MSEGLLSYFILKSCALSRDDRRQILLANKNAYARAGIVQALRISFHDMHEREKDRTWKPEARKGQGRFATRRSYAVHESDGNYDDGEDAYSQEDQGEDYADFEDEEAYIAGENDKIEEASDAGASNDDEVFDAYAAKSKVKQSYQDARKKLRDIQRSRGFFKSDGGGDRRKQIEQEKSIPGALLATELDIGQEIQHVLVQESQVLNVVQRARARAVVEAVQARVDLSELRT